MPDRKRIEKALTAFCERIPAKWRNELRNGYTITGSQIELFEERPVWDNPSRWRRSAVAKFRYVTSRDTWKLYCQFRDLKWRRHEPRPSGSFEALLQEVQLDPEYSFWG